MEDKIKQLVDFVEVRYLWQFHSRAWDREENIKVVTEDTYKLLTGAEIDLDTLIKKAHYADARIFADAIKEKFSWFLELADAEKKQVLDGVQAKLLELTVTKSRNEELKNPNY